MQVNGMNEWQRLWVVASLMIGLGFVFIGWQNIPTEESEATAYSATSGFVVHFTDGTSSNDVAAQKYVDDKDDLIYRQLGYAGTMLAIWVGTCAVLYAIGYGCGWVYRGFRPKTV